MFANSGPPCASALEKIVSYARVSKYLGLPTSLWAPSVRCVLILSPGEAYSVI